MIIPEQGDYYGGSARKRKISGIVMPYKRVTDPEKGE